MVELLNTGLDFNHLWILQNIGSLPDHIKIRGWVLLLQQKGYLDETNSLTELGNKILELVDTPPEECSTIEGELHAGFCSNVHKKMQDLMAEKTGKRNKTLYGSHSFICGPKDLETKLKSVMNRYGINDLAKVEKVLLAYVERCVRHQFDKVQLVQYYLMKDNVSAFSVDYDAYEEPRVREEKQVTKKDLF